MGPMFMLVLHTSGSGRQRGNRACEVCQPGLADMNAKHSVSNAWKFERFQTSVLHAGRKPVRIVFSLYQQEPKDFKQRRSGQQLWDHAF